MKQLFYLMFFCTYFVIVSCNKETDDATNAVGIRTPKLNENSLSLDEAKTTFARASKEAKTSLAGGASLNLADFDPQWQDATSANFTDTTGNLFAVPTTIFQAGGYKKLFFMRHNGQVTFLVLTVKGTAEYLIRTNGHCTMNDFSGDIYFTNAEGIHTGGYRLSNGQVTAWLVPSTRPRPEFEDVDKDGGIFDEVVITAPRPPSNSGTIYYGSLDFSNNLSYSSFMNNDFRPGGSGSGSSNGTNNSTGNGTAPPPVNRNLCAATFTVTDNIPNHTKGMGVSNMYMPMAFPDGSTFNMGYTGLIINVPRINRSNGQVISDASAARIAANAINIAQGALQLQIDRGGMPKHQPTLLKEFSRIASVYIDEKVGILTSSPRVVYLTWQLSATSQTVNLGPPVLGCLTNN